MVFTQTQYCRLLELLDLAIKNRQLAEFNGQYVKAEQCMETETKIREALKNCKIS